MENNEVKFGFRQVEVSDLPELDATAYRFTHEKSGADVLFLKNSDPNRVFGIGFRTPQENSTGVPHIIEHCVLNGSRKYKTKEPFMDLARSSMATFLNAMTSSDMTVYPVASRNEQDYRNLMDVYLDAVFFPVLHENEMVFRQEGWRYQLMDKADPLTYSGVVYNEMRGAYSSPQSIVYREMIQNLFPDTHYANDSGGEPYTIPELTYEYFKDFHKKYYAPSNSRIFFYGDLDIDHYLEYLDTEYLANFDIVDVDSSIKVQKPFDHIRKVESEYSLSADEEVEEKDYFTYAVVMNRYSDVRENMILEILADALFTTASSPVRLALEEAELAQDVSGFAHGMNQSLLAVILQNAKPDAGEKLQGIVEDTLQKLIEEGIDKKLITASLNRLEYALREGGSFPTKGILYFMKAFDTWNYGGDPLDQLRYEDLLADLRNCIDTDLWEKFVQEKILDNNHKLLLHLKPVPGLNDEKDKQVHEALQEKKASMSDEEIDKLVQFNQEMKAWQDSEDTDEIKATMPQLSLEDIETSLPNPPVDVEVLDEDEILSHDVFTSAIHYGRLSFPLNHLDLDELFYVQFLSEVLTLVDTEHYTFKDLGVEIYLETGGVGFSTGLYRTEEEKALRLRFEVSWKTLAKASDTWPKLIEEVLTKTKFTNDKRLLELIRMQLVSKEQGLLSSGNQTATTRALSHIDLGAKIADSLLGVDYYLKLKDLSKNFQERKEEFIQKLEEVYTKVFSRNGVVLSLTTAEEDLSEFKASSVKILEALPGQEKVDATWEFEKKKVKEGIQSSSSVQYVVKAYNYEDLDVEYKGDMAVLSTVLSRTYLHNQIRAAGGAYGTSLSITESGNIAASSYRDPNLKRSLEVYDNMGQWLSDQDLTQSDVEQYIIGSINRFDPPMSPSGLGKLAYVRYLTGRTVEEQEAKLNEALAATEVTLKAYRPLLDQAMEEDLICVIGNSEVIKEHKDLFDELISL